MAGSCNIFCCAAEFHVCNDFSYKSSSVWADYMRAQGSVGFCVCEEFYHSVGITCAASAAIYQKESEAEPEKHEVDDHHEHDVSESVEDMASEGGHVEEDSPEEGDETEQK